MNHSSSDEMKGLVLRIIDEVYNRGNIDIVDELFDPDFVYHDPLTPEEGASLEEYKQFLGFMRATFPDLSMTTEEIIAEDDVVAQRWSWTATHQGEMLGVAPTGKRITDKGIAWGRIRDGKVLELQVAPDAVGVLQQVGLIPELEVAPA